MTKQMLGLVAGTALVVGLALGSVGAALAGRASTRSGPAGDPSGGSQSAYSSSMMGTPGPGGMMGSYGPSGMRTTCHPSGMMAGGNQGTPQGQRVTLNQAQQNAQHYIDQFGNPNLAIDDIMEFQRNFYAIVADKSTGHGAFEVLVNKATGAVCPEYGPAMMWNTTYGMMGHMMGYQQPSGPMMMSATQALQIAQRWLDQHQPGATTEVPYQFPGYYTLHIRRNGAVTGMLSVNGYSGQVWYHTWHGAFIRMTDLHA